ncbi:MAG: DUF6056 family protein [Butyrivibrio sp.]|nr:DUF6056 family protein [Butyrivibrio sp.]
MKKTTFFNIILYGIIVAFVLSLIPVLYTAGFDFATGDDLGYGALVRHAWLEEHSLLACIKGAVNKVADSYKSWQGTWFTLFLFCFSPENFGFGNYVLVPYIMMGIQLIAMAVFMHRLLVYRLGIDKKGFLALLSLVLFINFQFIKYPTCGFFWWTGTVHYVIPFSLFLIAVTATDIYLEKQGIVSLIVLSLSMLLVGGGSYQAAVLTFVTVVLFYLWKRIVFGLNNNKKSLMIFIPVVLELTGLYISAKAPGNKVRGGENFGFSIGMAISVILNSFVYAIKWILELITENTVVLAILVIIALLIYMFFKENKGYPGYDFKFPLLFVIMNFCIFASVFAPELYAAVDVSGGVYNTYLYSFVLMVVIDIIYVEGYLFTRIGDRQIIKGVSPLLLILILAFAELIMIFIGRHGIKASTDYVCIEYIRSGAAEDYKEQMEQYYELLSTDEKDVVLPEVNNEQGPLQCMPVTGDVSNFTNYVTADYYYKNTVMAIPRQEWESLYNTK